MSELPESPPLFQTHDLKPAPGLTLVSGARIGFSLGRTLLRGAGLFGLPSTLKISIEAGTLGVEVSWSPPMAREGLALRLLTEAVGEPVQLAPIEWIEAIEPAAGPPSAIAAPAPTLFPSGELRDRYVHEEDRKRSAPPAPKPAAPADAVARGKKFFRDLDLRSNPDCSLPAYYQQATFAVAVSERLKQRVMARARALGQGLPVPTSLPYQLRDLKIFSPVQLGLYRAIWGPQFERDAVALAEIGAAFESFASGRFFSGALQPNGHPNSAFYFLFAEFAFAILDSSEMAADHRPWRALLPALVGTQPIFCEAYKPDVEGPWGWSDWRTGSAGAFHVVTDAEIARLRGEYAVLVAGLEVPETSEAAVQRLREAAARNACDALARELLPIQLRDPIGAVLGRW